MTSFGGLLFMIISTSFAELVVILEAGPVYLVLTASLRGTSFGPLSWLWVGVSLTAVLILSVLAVILPMRYGTCSLAGRE